MFFFFSILGYKMISDSDNIKIPYSMKHLVLIDFLSTYSEEKRIEVTKAKRIGAGLQNNEH